MIENCRVNDCQKRLLVADRDALAKALEKIIEMNRQHAKDQYGDADKAESWSCITVARAALASIKETTP